MIDLFQRIPIGGSLGGGANVSAGAVNGYTFQPVDGRQFQNTGTLDNASSQGAANVVAGPAANATGSNSTSIGQQASVNGGGSTAVGQGTTVTGGNSSVVGSQANTQGSNDVVIGAEATAGMGGNNVVIGEGASTRTNNAYLSVVIGAGAVASNAHAVTIGSASAQGGMNDVVIGTGTSSGTGGNNTIVGEGASTASGNTSDNTVVGQGASATGGNCTAVGQGNTVSGANSTAIGRGNTVTNVNNCVIGNGISSQGDNQLVFSADGTNPPIISLNGAILQHAAAGYSALAITSSTSGNGNVFSISCKDGVECAIAANRAGSGSHTPINFYTNATKVLQIDLNGDINFLVHNHTGTTSVNLGSNSPAGIGTVTPYTWVDVVAADGTLCTMPMWKQ